MITIPGITLHEKPIILNDILSRDKFEKTLYKFLTNEEENIILISVNPLVDKQRRLDLIISIINDLRF